MAVTYFFVTSLMMITILAPLYMLELGFSPFWIGATVATAALVSFFGQLPAGVCCDRFSRRLLLGLSFCFLGAAGIGIMLGNSLPFLFLAMGLRGMSGSLFWPTAQSYASLVDPPRASVILGRQTGAMAVATLTGALLAGYMAAFYGFTPAFLLAVVLSAAGTALSIIIPELRQTEQTHPRGLTVIFGNALQMLLANRSLQLAVICAFIAAIPIALNGSFYPVYFVSIGYDERIVGVLSAILNLAIVPAGMAFTYFHRRFRSKPVFMISLLGMALSMLFLSISRGLLLLSLTMLLQGFVLGLVLVMRLTLASNCTATEERGSAIGMVEMGFCAALFLLPLFYGSFLEKIGFAASFQYLSLFLFATALLSNIPFHRLKLYKMQQVAVPLSRGEKD